MNKDDWKNADIVRIGRAMCSRCGHHPLMHLSAGFLLDGIPRPCDGAKEGEPACVCMRYVATVGDEAMLIPGRHS